MEITFQFASLSDFISMHGHGIYVWLCYFAGLIAFCWLALCPKFKMKSFIRIQRAIFSRQHS